MIVIKEHSTFRTTWDLLVVMAILGSSYLVPAQIAFVHEVSFVGSLPLHVITLLLIIDIVLNFFTSHRSGGVEITDRTQIRRHYLRTMFGADLVANFPFEFLLLGLSEATVSNVSLVLIVRLLHLLRIVRLVAIFRRWEDKSWTNTGYLRIGKFLVVVSLFIHWTACSWFFAAFFEGFPPDSWVCVTGIADASPWRQYLRSLYWAITTMTTVGYGDITPHRDLEYVLSMFVMLLGASMYAYIIGNIASLVSNLDAAKARYKSRLDAVNQHLRARRAPAELNERVRNYYEYSWARHRGVREEEMFRDLPEPLRLDVLHHMTKEFLATVPLFKYSSPLLRDVLLTALKSETHAPGGYIVKEGEGGEGIYFISSGEAEIISHDGTMLHGRLKAGDYFGDLSLILGEKRTASVQTLTYCEIYVLRDVDFIRIKQDYPMFTDVLKTMSSEKSEKMSSLLLEGVFL